LSEVSRDDSFSGCIEEDPSSSGTIPSVVVGRCGDSTAPVVRMRSRRSPRASTELKARKRTMSSLVSRIAVSSLCAGIHRMEKVKFGVSLDQVCVMYSDIPAPLLILILKLNKEAPAKKDVFRAPGHQANMKKLIHVLQTGRLVNIDNFNIYTIASVLKKFLGKLPGGIFGSQVEARLFEIHEWDDADRKREEINRLITSLPIVNQQLLVLLFGTFQTIAAVAERESTGMTSEALGISVAPSFFHSCISEGCKTAKMEDLQRYKVAISIMKFLIDNFGVCNLFGLANYEYYARLTSRVLHVEDNWIFAYKYPHDLLESHSGKTSPSGDSVETVKLEELRNVNRHAERTKSLSFLPQVHERQTQRMKIRSEWFLSPDQQASVAHRHIIHPHHHPKHHPPRHLPITTSEHKAF